MVPLEVKSGGYGRDCHQCHAASVANKDKSYKSSVSLLNIRPSLITPFLWRESIAAGTVKDWLSGETGCMTAS